MKQLDHGSNSDMAMMSADHLSRLSRLFRTELVPLQDWIWKQRQDAYRRNLTDPRWCQQGISDIAFPWGFNTAAHFSRSFREEYGMSPREWLHGVLPGAHA